MIDGQHRLTKSLIEATEFGPLYVLYVTADLTQAYEHAANATHLIRHFVYLKPDIWLIIDDLAAAEPSTFELLFHSDHAFRQIGDAQYAAGGEKGSVRLDCLYPEAVTIDCETQIAIGASSVHADQPMELLRIRNAAPAPDGMFVALLEAHRANDAPKAVASVDRDGASLTVTIEADSKKYVVPLPALGAVDPVEVTLL